MNIEQKLQAKKLKKRRLTSTLFILVAIIAGLFIGEGALKTSQSESLPTTSGPLITSTKDITNKYPTAQTGLEALPVKGRAPKTGYTRGQFGSGWLEAGGCDTRNRILARDLKEVQYKINSCVVVSGSLNDPYTAKTIQFIRGQTTSDDVQIDHVVALSDSWQKGAQLLSPGLREQFANDGLNLLAVDGSANMNKGDGDAATWLPPNKSIRCGYVARQVTVKLKYSLWITAAEKSAIANVLQNCPNQQLAQ